MKKNSILIALQDYQTPNYLMKYGVKLAYQAELPAHLLAIESVPSTMMPPAVVGTGTAGPQMEYMTDLKVIASKKITAIGEQAKNLYNNVTWDIEIGFAESKLLQYGDDYSPFLVLIEGQNELSFINEWFSTYETRLASSITTPILIVPENMPTQQLHHILYIMKPEDKVLDHIGRLAQLVNRFNANLSIAYIIDNQISPAKEQDPRFIAKMKLLDQSLRGKILGYHQLSGEDITTKTQNLIQQTRAQWLCVEQKDATMWDYLFGRHYNDRLILTSKVPVLVI